MSAEVNVIHFIRKIKEHRILWDYSHAENTSVGKKTIVWRELSKEFGVNVETLKRCWKRLRNSYARERNKEKNADGTLAYSTWRYSKYLQFLEGHFKIRSSLPMKDPKQMKNLEDEDEYSFTADEDRVRSPYQDSDIEICSETEVELLVPHSQDDEYLRIPENFNNFGTATVKTEVNRRREQQAIANRNIEEDLLTAMGSIENYVKTLHNNSAIADASDDEDELFCRSVAKKIKKLPLITKNEVKLHMLSYLNEVEEQQI